MTPAREYTFGSFVATQGTDAARRLCLSIVRSGRSAPRLLLLHGPTGTGKTHLLRAVAATVTAADTRRGVQTTADLLTRELITEIRGDRVAEFAAAYDGIQLLLIDDLHQLATKPGTQQALGGSLARCAASGTMIVGAATAPVEDLAPFCASLRDVVPVRQCVVRPPTAREMRTILARLASDRSVKLTARTARRLTARIGGDVRRAIGAVTYLEAASTSQCVDAAPPWIEDFADHARW